MEVLILTGDRDSIQLVTDRSTVLYPMRGVSDLARMTPAWVAGQVRRAAVALPRDRRAGGGDLGQPARRARRRCGLRRQVDQPVRRARQRHHPRRRDPGQEGRGAARAPRRRDPQPPAQRAGPRPRRWTWLRPTSRCGRGTGTRCTRCSTAWSSGVLRDRLFETLSSEEEIEEGGFDMSTNLLGAGQLAGWLAEHATAGDRVGVHVVGRWGAGSGDVTGVALATTDGHRGVHRRRRPRRRRPGRAGDLARRPEAAEGPARRQGTDARARGVGDAAVRARPRHRAVGVPRPARPALLRPGRPHRPLPQARAQAGRRRRRPAQPRRSGRRQRRRGRDAARPGGARPGRRPRRRARGARRHPRCSTTSSCRWSTCSRRWSRPASRSTPSTSRRSRATSRPRCAARPRRRTP